MKLVYLTGLTYLAHLSVTAFEVTCDYKFRMKSFGKNTWDPIDEKKVDDGQLKKATKKRVKQLKSIVLQNVQRGRESEDIYPKPNRAARCGGNPNLRSLECGSLDYDFAESEDDEYAPLGAYGPDENYGFGDYEELNYDDYSDENEDGLLAGIPRVIVLLDETGSMRDIPDATIAAFNEFLSIEKSMVDGEAFTPKFTAIQFAYWAEPVCYNDIMSAADLTSADYVPKGCTSLYDAIGCTLENYKNENGNIFVVITDGRDTCSEIYNQSVIRDKIQEFSSDEKGWSFVFHGADQDSEVEAKNLGISTWFNFQRSERGINQSFTKAADQVRDLRTGSSIKSFVRSNRGQKMLRFVAQKIEEEQEDLAEPEEPIFASD